MKYTVIGVMSGTSLDGMDMACCTFEMSSENLWKYTIDCCQTIPYSNHWNIKLNSANKLNGYDLIKLHYEYGHFIGEKINDFIKENTLDKSSIDCIASHGHTIFHKPGEGVTFQLGYGAAIAANTGLCCVSDFRGLDVALQGHGAPLVPIGDKLLFSEYQWCLNLGGFSNISFDSAGKRIAFDICPVNIIINQLARHREMEYDKDGHLASQGIIHNDLLKELDKLDYYQQKPPKSLGREWLEDYFSPIINRYHLQHITENLLRTIYEHISNQIVQTILEIADTGKLLITGGGAKNKFLIDLITTKLDNKIEVIIPDEKIIDHKEALIFAFLGLLRLLKKENCLASVTGAKIDNIGGSVFHVK